jgi:hypothetical protein
MNWRTPSPGFVCMDRRWTFATLALCAVVVVASFLPWGFVSHGAQFELGEAIRVDISEPTSHVDAWNSYVGGENFRLPNWLVPAIAAVVGLATVMRIVLAARFLVPALTAWAEIQTLWFAISIARRERNAIGIGLVLTLASLMGIFVAVLRRPPRMVGAAN